MPSGGINAYARWRKERNLAGGTPPGVQKALRAGRIKYEDDGKIDFEKADCDWAENTDPTRGKPLGMFRVTPAEATRTRLAAGPSSKPAAGQAGADDSPDAENVAPPDTDLGSFRENREEREKWLAKQAKLDYQRDAKELLPAGEVKQMFFSLGRIHASARESLPMDLAPRLVGLTDLNAIEKILRDELRACDSRVARECEVRFGETLSAATNEAA